MMHKIKRLARLIKNTYSKPNRTLVLIYHRVANLDNDPQQLAVSPEKFEEQIKYLKKRFKIISLQEMVQSLSYGKIQDKSVVITFDDGYADNLYYAKPILEKHNVPATVFVTAGMIGSEREYWWDELERIFLLDEARFKPLKIEVNGKEYFWDINRRDTLRQVYNELHVLLKYLTHQERSEIIDKLFVWAGIPLSGRGTHRSMTEAEVKALAQGGIIEIGAHTMTHCLLACESKERQAWEIAESKRKLEEILGSNVTSFSYPFGTSEDFTDDSMRYVQDMGFDCGIANEQGIVTKAVSLYAIPRCLVRNWDLNEFQNSLDNFTGSNQPDLFEKVITRVIGSDITNSTYKKKLLPRTKKHPITRTQCRKLSSVLQINMIDCVGGAAKVAYRLHESWIKRSYDSRMLVAKKFSDSHFVKILLKDNSIRQRILNYYQEKWSWQDFFQMESFDIINKDFFKNSNIIHLHNLHQNYFSIFALPEISALKPVVWTLHDMQAITGHCAHSLDCNRWLIGCGDCPDLTIYPAINTDTSAFLWQTKKNIYDNSCLTIVCPSQWLKRKVEQSILRNNDIRLIYNGVDQSVYKKYNKDQARKALNLPLEKKILLFCADGGAANSWKGGQYIGLLYEFMHGREDVLFLNVGGSKYEHKSSNWLDISYVDNENIMAMYYSAADLFIYPSVADNCPLVVLESMACGTPVVAFDTGGIPELVEHLQTGYIAEYKSVDDFIKGVNLFLNDGELYQKASNESIRAVTNKFNIESMVDAYEKVYLEVLHNHG